MKTIAQVTLLAILAAGCATAPGPALYTLDMSPSEKAGAPVNIEVGRLRVAEALLTKRILIKTSPTEINYYAVSQWVASLDELLAEKLAVEFGPIDAARPTYVISGSLLAFEQVDTSAGGDAHARFQVEVRAEGTSYYSKPALSKIYDVRIPAESASVGGVVEALSRGVEQIAREIVADIAALPPVQAA